VTRRSRRGATAGHELRTPLAALLLQVESLQRALRRGDATGISERLKKLARSGYRLSQLVSQLLDVSRITAGRLRLEPEPVELAPLLREAIARFTDADSPTKATIALRCDEGVNGSWDRLRIDQVVTNLLSNAVRYGRGQPIEVDVRRDGNTAVVSVTDHGIGIHPENQQKIFLRFEQATAPREYGGIGLGLWIAREIVEASGGTIDVESRPERGSTFTFRLPLNCRVTNHAVA
jgi:signal transduction histidine kinase